MPLATHRGFLQRLFLYEVLDTTLASHAAQLC
jgi:hypothetical protein